MIPLLRPVRYHRCFSASAGITGITRSIPSSGGVSPRTWRVEPTSATSLPAQQELGGLPQLSPGNTLPTPSLSVCHLPSGLTVASHETYSQVSTLALFIEAGSMFERPEEVGSCHFLEATAFKATEGLSGEEVQHYTQRYGMTTGSVFNREVLMFKVDALRGNLREALHLLGEAALRPRLGEEDMAEAKQTIAYQRDEDSAQPSIIVAENLWKAAYGGDSPLGRPEKCPPSRVPEVTAGALKAFIKRNFVAPRMVLAGVGVQQGELMAALAGTPLSALASSNSSSSSSASSSSSSSSSYSSSSSSSSSSIVRPTSLYQGGEVRVSPDWASLPPTIAAMTAKTQFTHVMLAFPTVGWKSDSVVPVCVTDTLLGGGSSFSAGGPGKGMYSRLYREALNAYPWMESANAFSNQLYDCGLMGIYGSAPPEHAGDLVRVMCSHMARLGESLVKDSELARARNQLASSVLMNLETRALLVEDIGRQILSHKKRLPPEVLTARIQATTALDIKAVMREAMAHPPSLSAVGDLSMVPEYAEFKVSGRGLGGGGGCDSACTHAFIFSNPHSFNLSTPPHPLPTLPPPLQRYFEDSSARWALDVNRVAANTR
jgi:processing peptidase subunit alpha